MSSRSPDAATTGELEPVRGSYYLAERKAALADLDRDALIELIVDSWEPAAHPDPRVREYHYRLVQEAQKRVGDLCDLLESVLDGYERERGGAPVDYDDFCARRDGARALLKSIPSYDRGQFA